MVDLAEMALTNLYHHNTPLTVGAAVEGVVGA